MNNQMQQFGDGGLKDEGGEIDEVSGNEVPVGGTKEGVRDDIPANVSEGEFIFPEDVVRFIGLDKLMSIRQDAKMGLKKMDAMGQMGNGDEASMPDDMPFDMTDIIVVGDNEQPMEFAGGGFIPVEDYTVVQDMIEDRSDKAAAIDKDKAMSDMIADNTTKSAVIDKENEIQNFAPGGSVGSMAGRMMGFGAASNMDTSAAEKAPANTTFDNPTTGQEKFDGMGAGPQASSSATTGRKKLTFKEMMGDQYAEILIYSNEAGDKLVVPAINGVPIYAPPPGYTLYVPPVEGEEEVGEPLPPEAVAAIQNINSNNDRRLDVNGNRKEPPQVDMPEPVPWATMSAEDFITETKKLTGTGRTIMEAALLFIPFVGLAGKAMLSHQDRTVQAIIAERKANGDFSAAQLTELEVINTALDKSSKGIFGAVVSAVGTALGAVGTAIKTALTGNDVITGSEEPPIVIVQSGAVSSSLRPKTRIDLSDAVKAKLQADDADAFADLGGPTKVLTAEERAKLQADNVTADAFEDLNATSAVEPSGQILIRQREAAKKRREAAESERDDGLVGTPTSTLDKKGITPEGGRDDGLLGTPTSMLDKKGITPTGINKLTSDNQTLDAFGGVGPTVSDPRSEDQRGTSAANIATTEVATSPIVNPAGGAGIDYFATVPTKAEEPSSILSTVKGAFDSGVEFLSDLIPDKKYVDYTNTPVSEPTPDYTSTGYQDKIVAEQVRSGSNNDNAGFDNFGSTQVTKAQADSAKDVQITGRTDSSGKTVGQSGYKSAFTERKEAKDALGDRKVNVGGRAKGGLINKPKSKKKTTNKRGLAARK